MTRAAPNAQRAEPTDTRALDFLTAEEQERKRLAAELHGNVGATLSAIKLGIEGYLCTIETDATTTRGELLRGIVANLDDVIDDLRSVTSALYPSILDDLGLPTAIAGLCRELRNAHPGTAITLSCALEEGDVPHALQIVLYRIVQEAFEAFIEMAGASAVGVELATDTAGIRVQITSNEDASDPTQNAEHGALHRIQQRAMLSGGSFSATAEPTAVTVSWPCRRDSPRDARIARAYRRRRRE